MPEHARCPSGATPVVYAEPGLEVAEIFRRYLAPFKDKHALGPVEDRIARDVMACRTAVLGGHLDVCTSCGFQRPAYNSCRNRHCPKCQALRGARWVEQRLDRILETPVSLRGMSPALDAGASQTDPQRSRGL